MPSTKQFYRLNIQELPPEVLHADRLQKVLLLVTDGGLTEERAVADHHSLQFLLYNTALFQFKDVFLPPNQLIGDVRNNGTLIRTCQDRAKLVEVLAETLRKYDSHCALVGIGIPHLQWRDANKAVDYLGSVLHRVFDLRDSGHFSQHPQLAYLHKHAVMDMHKTLTAIVRALTPSDFHTSSHHDSKLVPENFFTLLHPTTGDMFCPETLEMDLLLAMRQAFRQYGPLQNYPQEAVYYAMAVILTACGLEEGALPEVASRLKQRLKRYDKQHPKA